MPRRVAAAVLLVAATLVWTTGIFAVWAERQALETDNWVETSERLLEDDEIRAAVATYLVDQVFASAPVEERLREALPPRLDRLAGPAAAGLRQVAERNAPRLLGTAVALRAWQQANEQAHNAFLAILAGDVAEGGEVTLDLRTLAAQIAERAGLPPETADRLPADVAQLQILKSDQLDAAQDAVDILGDLPIILGLLAAVLFAAAIWLSADRRRAVVSVGSCLIVAGIAALAVRALGERVVVNALADAPNAHDVADDAWQIATALLANATQGSMLFGLLVVTGAWLVGPGRRATDARRLSAPVLRDRPGVAYSVLAGVLLLLVVWGPVPWTQNLWPMLIFAAAAFAWLEWVRRRTAGEFPEAGGAATSG